jgi:hypothetical protein
LGIRRPRAADDGEDERRMNGGRPKEIMNGVGKYDLDDFDQLSMIHSQSKIHIETLNVKGVAMRPNVSVDGGW